MLRDHSLDLLSGKVSIEEAHPMQPRWVAEEVAARSYFAASFANVTAFDTDAGLVLVDTGSFVLADATRALLNTVVASPAHTAIWTHGHVDHCFGVEGYEADAGRPVHVIAHEAVSRRFARYQLTQGYNDKINARQFQTTAGFPASSARPTRSTRTARASTSAVAASSSITRSARPTTRRGCGSRMRACCAPAIW